MQIYQVFFMDYDDNLYKKTGFYAVAASAAAAVAKATMENEVPPEFMHRVEWVLAAGGGSGGPIGRALSGGFTINPAGDMRFK